MKYIKLLLILLISLFFVNTVSATNIIYDNITTSQYKTIKISDDFNIKYLNEYKYEVYINSNFAGYYLKDELIFIPDNSNVIIYIPAPVKTDFSNTWEMTKSMLINLIGFIMAFIFIIVIIIIFYKKIFRRR